jgi:hypothetical protein
LNLLPQSTAVQERGGVSISVTPTPFTRARAVQYVNVQTQPFLAVVARDTRFYRRTETPLAVVSPDNLSFKIGITNQLPRVFRGAGAVVSLSVNNRTAALTHEASQDFLNSAIPPRGQAEFTIPGPTVAALPDSGVIGLFIYDVVVAVDAAGNPTRRENFEWNYALSRDVSSDTASIVTRDEQQPMSEPFSLSGVVGLPTSAATPASAGSPESGPAANTVARGQAVQGVLTSSDPQMADRTVYKAYAYTALAAEVITVDLVSSDFDAYLIILDANGNKIAQDDDSGGGTNARITVTLAPGTYRILANVLSAGRYGRFTLSVR